MEDKYRECPGCRTWQSIRAFRGAEGKCPKCGWRPGLMTEEDGGYHSQFTFPVVNGRNGGGRDFGRDHPYIKEKLRIRENRLALMRGRLTGDSYVFDEIVAIIGDTGVSPQTVKKDLACIGFRYNRSVGKWLKEEKEEKE